MLSPLLIVISPPFLVPVDALFSVMTDNNDSDNSEKPTSLVISTNIFPVVAPVVTTWPIILFLEAVLVGGPNSIPPGVTSDKYISVPSLVPVIFKSLTKPKDVINPSVPLGISCVATPLTSYLVPVVVLPVAIAKITLGTPFTDGCDEVMWQTCPLLIWTPVLLCTLITDSWPILIVTSFAGVWGK